MEPPLPPCDSGRFVAERSRDVFVEVDGVKKVADMLHSLRHSDDLTASGWKKANPLAPAPTSDQGSSSARIALKDRSFVTAYDGGSPTMPTSKLAEIEQKYSLKNIVERALNWVFVVDTMNFSFWPDSEDQQCEVTYKGTTYTGYMTLCAAVTRAIDEGVPITDPTYFSRISVEELAHVLRSDNATPMPMLEDRHRVLTEGGRVLLEHGGSFRSFISLAGSDARKMVELIVEKLASYRDETTYEGKKISFYKRAQILVADFWGIMEAKGEGDIPNLDCLTMFADYRVPQALVYLGVLRYSDALMQTLNNGETLVHGDRREVEIRGCSVWSVELIKDHLCRLVQERDGQKCNINSAIIDFYLWLYAKRHHKELAHIPIHHTRCIYY